MLRIVFMGSPEFAVPSLQAVLEHHEVVLVVTQPDKPAGRGRGLLAPAVKRVAEAAGVAVAQPASARKPEVAEMLRATGADLAVVVAYGKILPPAVLTAFPRGCINVHASLLPAYRGAAPIQWAVINGERETGVTIMQLDEGMDTGPTYLERRCPIDDGDTAGSLAERLAPIGAAALVDALAAIEAGTAVATAQDPAAATYAGMLDKRLGAIDLGQPAGKVRDLIRGLDPWPVAYVAHGGELIKLFGASLADGSGAIGEVLAVDDGGVVVACGSGAVRIRDGQAPGKRRMAFAELARGRGITAGTVLARAEQAGPAGG